MSSDDEWPSILAVDALDPSLSIAVQAAQAGRRRLPRVPTPPVQTAQDRRYSKAIINTVAPAIEIVREELFPMLDSLVSQAENERVTVDTSIDDLQRLFGIVQVRFADIFTDQSVDDAIETGQTDINDQNRRTFRRQIKTVLGIDPIQAEPWLADVLQSHAAENASLIKTLPTEAMSDIQEITTRGLRRGDSPATIRKVIQERWKVTEGRARVIGRDQVSKLNSALTQSRQVSLGVTRYSWLDSDDGKVRPSHKRRDGKIFEWGKPIQPQLREQGLPVDEIDGHPGEPIQCRCDAIPVLSDLV